MDTAPIIDSLIHMVEKNNFSWRNIQGFNKVKYEGWAKFLISISWPWHQVLIITSTHWLRKGIWRCNRDKEWHVKMYVSTSGYRHIIQRPARFWEPNYIICLVLIEPQSFEEAMACEESSQWLQAMKEETISLKKNKSCHYCITQISYKWVYWIKQKTDGSVDWFKIRLCQGILTNSWHWLSEDLLAYRYDSNYDQNSFGTSFKIK